jgi:ribose transport system ATP-binding protein
VLLVSTEPTDLVETCDRILVLHPGRPPRELRTSDPDDVLEAIYGVPTSSPSTADTETGALHV